MKNTDTSGNKIRNAAQRTTRNATKCMTQSTFQKKILDLVQRAGDKVAEAMNIVGEVGAIAGINVHFERSNLAERNEPCDYRGKHSRHSDINWGSRYGQSKHTSVPGKADEVYDIDDIDNLDEPDDEIKEVTIPELAEMVAERTCFKPECTLCVINTAFDIMDEQNLMLDLGTISADTPEDADECYEDGCCDCDGCGEYYGDDNDDDSKDTDSEDICDSYDCDLQRCRLAHHRQQDAGR